MALTISINIPCDTASLTEAAELIEALRDLYPSDLPEAPAVVLGGAGLPPQPPLATAQNPEDFIQAWLRHLGPASRKFWRDTAQYAATGRPSITFEDLELATGIAKGSLRSYHRNSYRAINHEKAPDPMPGSWDATTKRNMYGMMPAVRDKILDLTRNDPA